MVTHGSKRVKWTPIHHNCSDKGLMLECQLSTSFFFVTNLCYQLSWNRPSSTYDKVHCIILLWVDSAGKVFDFLGKSRMSERTYNCFKKFVNISSLPRTTSSFEVKRSTLPVEASISTKLCKTFHQFSSASQQKRRFPFWDVCIKSKYTKKRVRSFSRLNNTLNSILNLRNRNLDHLRN